MKTLSGGWQLSNGLTNADQGAKASSENWDAAVNRSSPECDAWSTSCKCSFEASQGGAAILETCSFFISKPGPPFGPGTLNNTTHDP